MSVGFAYVVKAENRGPGLAPRRKPHSAAEAGRVQATGESTQAENLQKGEGVRRWGRGGTADPASPKKGTPCAKGHPFLAPGSLVNHLPWVSMGNAVSLAPLCQRCFPEKSRSKERGPQNGVPPALGAFSPNGVRHLMTTLISPQEPLTGLLSSLLC